MSQNVVAMLLLFMVKAIPFYTCASFLYLNDLKMFILVDIYWIGTDGKVQYESFYRTIILLYPLKTVFYYRSVIEKYQMFRYYMIRTKYCFITELY